MLDLTDDGVLRQLGTVFEKLVLTMNEKKVAYEFTNVVGTWARERGYKGLIVPGARGTKNYDNIVIFEQSNLDTTIGNLAPIKLK
jgi:hypothetical protein